MSEVFYSENARNTNCVSDKHADFKYMEVDQGIVSNIQTKKDKYILFFLEGSAKVGYNEFPCNVFNAGEMIFLPKSADCKVETLTKSRAIILAYDNPMQFCGKMTLESVIQSAKNITYEFKSLVIKNEIMQYLLLLEQYLQDSFNCQYLQEIKQKELFLLLGIYYEKEELARFFFPMLGKSMDFRSKVMTHYLSVRTSRELAAACLYSERRFNELFVEEFGESPYQWMQKQKAKHVVSRLSEKDVPIKDIVNEFSFTSQSHFNKYCIRQLGDTATRIRQRLLTDDQRIK